MISKHCVAFYYRAVPGLAKGNTANRSVKQVHTHTKRRVVVEVVILWIDSHVVQLLHWLQSNTNCACGENETTHPPTRHQPPTEGGGGAARGRDRERERERERERASYLPTQHTHTYIYIYINL